MGITGLIPFLEKSSRRTDISEFRGKTVAIDSYCWLHKGAFSCAEKLMLGEHTNVYVNYCLKYVHMLLQYKIKPILVFDGRHLPAKAQTEEKRREKRRANREKAAQLMKMGKHAEAHNLLKRAIDISHEMALELIKKCQKLNVDCIVAPYEADSQLAYLNINGLADVVITEDSDLLLFGCKKVFFKMDMSGHGLLIEHDQLYRAMDTNCDKFSMDDFIYMCVLSGCDYLPSLPGIGLGKARKFIKLNTNCDIHQALTRMPSYLRMKSLNVTQEYRDAFILAIITFKHQLVYCPLTRRQVRLNPPPANVTNEQLYYAGEETDPETALQLALGNYDPFTLKKLHNFDPDKAEMTRNDSGQISFSHASIWSRKYELSSDSQSSQKQNSRLKKPNVVNNHKDRLKQITLVEREENFECEKLDQQEILSLYEFKSSTDLENDLGANEAPVESKKLLPCLTDRNPFLRQSSVKSPNIQTSPNTRTSPSAQYSPNARTPPSAQYSPNARTPPSAQCTPNARTPPSAQCTPNARYSSRVQSSPCDQLSPGVQSSPSAQFSPRRQSSPSEERVTSPILIRDFLNKTKVSPHIIQKGINVIKARHARHMRRPNRRIALPEGVIIESKFFAKGIENSVTNIERTDTLLETENAHLDKNSEIDGVRCGPLKESDEKDSCVTGNRCSVSRDELRNVNSNRGAIQDSDNIDKEMSNKLEELYSSVQTVDISSKKKSISVLDESNEEDLCVAGNDRHSKSHIWNERRDENPKRDAIQEHLNIDALSIEKDHRNKLGKSDLNTSMNDMFANENSKSSLDESNEEDLCDIGNGKHRASRVLNEWSNVSSPKRDAIQAHLNMNKESLIEEDSKIRRFEDSKKLGKSCLNQSLHKSMDENDICKSSTQSESLILADMDPDFLVRQTDIDDVSFNFGWSNQERRPESFSNKIKHNKSYSNSRKSAYRKVKDGSRWKQTGSEKKQQSLLNFFSANPKK